MKTYWEYEDKERATLTDTEVRSLLKYALMEAGALDPVAPEMEALESLDKTRRKTFFTIKTQGKYGGQDYLPIVFATREAACAFLELKPALRDYNYECGHDNYYA